MASKQLIANGLSKIIQLKSSVLINEISQRQYEIVTTPYSFMCNAVQNTYNFTNFNFNFQLRNSLEPILTPVNFRTSPPLEAFKPNRSHKYRSTTPLILSEARCGIENIKLCDNSVNDENGRDDNAAAHAVGGNGVQAADDHAHAAATKACHADDDDNASCSVIKACASSLKMSNSSHHIYQPQPKYNFQYNSSRSSPASTTGLDVEVRSVSPPAKLFHCAISPKRRPMRQQHATTQRLQRPHRPCLDFDKMQQVSL